MNFEDEIELFFSVLIVRQRERRKYKPCIKNILSIQICDLYIGGGIENAYKCIY